jgi:hypothetical protein
VPIVAELFGFPFGSEQSKQAISKAICPYTQDRCDGGGNRDMAQVALASDSGIRARFAESVIKSGSVSCAICSVGMRDGNKIICPRRLLNFGPNGYSDLHKPIVELLCKTAGFKAKATVKIWSEISLNFKQGSLKFDYRLDYLLREVLSDGNFGPPIIVEIMTCSTSGGNKAKGTDIQTAFRKALLANQGDSVPCPGINIRQVWARMASQLIVKSEASIAWGGKTIWVVQDALADYMKNNTGLKLESLRSDTSGEVNIITHSGEAESSPILYSGPISQAVQDGSSFSDILRAPFLPSKEMFLSKFVGEPSGSFVVPG